MSLTESDRARIVQTVAAMPGNDDADEQPDDSRWWHTDSEEAFVEMAVELVGLGVPVDRALGILERAYSATANEFGA